MKHSHVLAHDARALVVDSHHINVAGLIAGEEPANDQLAFVFELRGHLNKSGRGSAVTVIVPRDRLGPMLEFIGWAGSMADRELVHELTAALERGMSMAVTAERPS